MQHDNSALTNVLINGGRTSAGSHGPPVWTGLFKGDAPIKLIIYFYLAR